MESYIKEAQEFHNLYEKLAPTYGYETRTDTKAFDPNSPNGKLMIAVVSTLLTEARKKWIDDLARTVAEHIQKNWYASLGYGNDVEVITRGCDDLDWLLGALGITTQDILKALVK